MGNKTSQVKISFEDMQQRIGTHNDLYVIINTLPNDMQNCLIGTLRVKPQLIKILQLKELQKF